MEKLKKIIKYGIFIIAIFLILSINETGDNNIVLENVEGNFFSILAKKIEEILVSLINFVFDLIKKVLNLFI